MAPAHRGLAQLRNKPAGLLPGSESELSPISLLAKKLAHKTADKTPLRPSALVPVTYQSASPGNGLSVHLPNGISLRGIASENLALVERLLVSLS